MIIIETPLFTRAARRLLSDEEYRQLQSALLVRPDRGVVIPGSGGLRKIRWKVSGRGKKGGARTIYYWTATRNEIYMLLVYGKAEQEELTRKQLQSLRRIVEEWNDG